MAEVDGQTPRPWPRSSSKGSTPAWNCQKATDHGQHPGRPGDAEPGGGDARRNRRLQVKSLTHAHPDSGRRLHGADGISHREEGAHDDRIAVGREFSDGRPASSATSVRSPAGPSARSRGSRPSVIPAVFVPAFFYAVNLGALENLARHGLDYKAFLIPMAIAFAVTGMSQSAGAGDRHPGRLLRPAVHDPDPALALLLGLMVGRCRGDRGPVPAGAGHRLRRRGAICHRTPGVLVFVGFSALWGLAFTGFPYAVALKTGSPAAVNACFVVFFPLFFLTDAVVPKQHSPDGSRPSPPTTPSPICSGRFDRLITSGWQFDLSWRVSLLCQAWRWSAWRFAFAALRARIRMQD